MGLAKIKRSSKHVENFGKLSLLGTFPPGKAMYSKRGL
jgi:hypothetical protein